MIGAALYCHLGTVGINEYSRTLLRTMPRPITADRLLIWGITIVAGFLVTDRLLGAWQRGRERAATRETCTAVLRDVNQIKAARALALERLGDINLDPEVLTLGDLERLLGGLGEREPTYVKDEIRLGWLLDGGPDLETCLRTHGKHAYRGSSAVWASFYGEPTAESRPIRLGSELGFRGRIKGIRLGIPAEGIRALSKAVIGPGAHEFPLDDRWMVSWDAPGHLVSSLALHDRRYVVVVDPR
jgi:hypothetical protein